MPTLAFLISIVRRRGFNIRRIANAGRQLFAGGLAMIAMRGGFRLAVQ